MAIDAAEQIEKFQEFIEQSYQKQLHENLNKGYNFLLIDFFDLTKYDPKLADQLLEEPEETVKAAEMALEQFEVKKGFRVRFQNLPKSQEIFIRNLRSKHLGKFIAMEGIIRQSSEVRPQAVSAKFECPSCGNTITMLQIDQQFREPSRCSCGRKGKFRLLSKELVDVQRLVIEESPENLEGGAQPKRMQIFLREDLVEPRMEKRTTPGTRIIVNGSLYEIPIQTKTGATSTRFDLAMQANYIEPVEEDYSEITITPEDEKEIKKIARDKDVNERLIRSISPSIYGHEKIKEAILLQLFGGIRKIKKDGNIVRGDLHVLLVGDPGCIVGESQVALLDKGMQKIGTLGRRHLEDVSYKLLTTEGTDIATKFHRYEKKLVLKVMTETGKHLICTLDHQLLTKDGWKRADCLTLGEPIRVMPSIAYDVQNYIPTDFNSAPKSSGKLKEVILPQVLTEDLAALYGYILGDGSIHSNGYRVTCYVSDDEKELLKPLTLLWQNLFHIDPVLITRKAKESLIVNNVGAFRVVHSSKDMHLLEINSRHIASCLSFLSHKRVPQHIFQSPKSVVASFLRWLFEADGCAFGNGRGRTSIQLKSRNPQLLQDVQLLLLYFGIQSRIVADNLCIRRAYDMQLYIQHIGFASEKKNKALEEVQKVIHQRERRRKAHQCWEKICSIDFVGIRDVYDFEVPRTHMFVANGIVSHNCGKSQMLTFVNHTAPKSRYVAGRSASGAGLTATVVKDEFLRGWALEAGAMVLADKGILVLDEMDKISKEDTSALHEAMEQQHISVAKANIQATLRTQTSILGAANPKLGRFDPFTPIPNQIDMPPALINRFDLIFVMRDIPNKELDSSIATRVLQAHAYKDSKPELEAPFIRKYLAYAKQKVFPILTDQAVETIKKFYVELRSTGTTGDGAIKPIPISARQLEAVVRLAEASARIKLKKEVEEEDALRAIGLLKWCMTEVGMDPETGKIDIDRMTTGISASVRGRIVDVKEVLYALSEEKQGGPISIEDDLKPKVFEKGITEKKLEEAIDMLKRSGDFYEPKKGWLQKI